ncbi:hypothetical protein JCM10213_001197 [Rhodosporidiobolus nylandii]
MSLTSLPDEPKERIMAFVKVQDSLTRRLEVRGGGGEANEPQTSGGEVGNGGLLALSCVNREMRHHAAEELLKTLDASLLLDFPLDSRISGAPLGSYIRVIRISLSDLESLDIFPLLRSLPSLSRVEFYHPPSPSGDPFDYIDGLLHLLLNAELRLLNEDADEAYEVLRELAGKQGMEWAFERASVETIALFVRRFGATLQHLEIGEVAGGVEDGLFSGNQPLLRRALGACDALKSLSVGWSGPLPGGYRSRAVVHSMPAVHPSWLSAPLSFASHLKSLSLALPSLDSSALTFLDRFPALSSLALSLSSSASPTAGDKTPSKSSEPLALGALSRLALVVPGAPCAFSVLSSFHLPLLRALSLRLRSLAAHSPFAPEGQKQARDVQVQLDALAAAVAARFRRVELVQLNIEASGKEEVERAREVVEAFKDRLMGGKTKAKRAKGVWVEASVE